MSVREFRVLKDPTIQSRPHLSSFDIPLAIKHSITTQYIVLILYDTA